MTYRFQVNQQTCINCGICMDLCPVRCLDMTRPAGEGEIGSPQERFSPIPSDWANRAWMMLAPVQVAPCIGCQVCVQECPTNAIRIESSVEELAYAKRGDLAACVRKLLDDPILYATMATKGRQRVLEHYTQEQIARQTYEVYQEMLAGKTELLEV